MEHMEASWWLLNVVVKVDDKAIKQIKDPSLVTSTEDQANKFPHQGSHKKKQLCDAHSKLCIVDIYLCTNLRGRVEKQPGAYL